MTYTVVRESKMPASYHDTDVGGFDTWHIGVGGAITIHSTDEDKIVGDGDKSLRCTQCVPSAGGN